MPLAGSASCQSSAAATIADGSDSSATGRHSGVVSLGHTGSASQAVSDGSVSDGMPAHLMQPMSGSTGHAVQSRPPAIVTHTGATAPPAAPRATSAAALSAAESLAAQTAAEIANRQSIRVAAKGGQPAASRQPTIGVRRVAQQPSDESLRHGLHWLITQAQGKSAPMSHIELRRALETSCGLEVDALFERRKEIKAMVLEIQAKLKDAPTAAALASETLSA